jgi:hypothetical protein
VVVCVVVVVAVVVVVVIVVVVVVIVLGFFGVGGGWRDELRWRRLVVRIRLLDFGTSARVNCGTGSIVRLPGVNVGGNPPRRLVCDTLAS